MQDCSYELPPSRLRSSLKPVHQRTLLHSELPNKDSKETVEPEVSQDGSHCTAKAPPALSLVFATLTFSPQPLPAIKATTDPDGNYRIPGIPAGSYQVSPMSPAYVVTDLVATRASGRTLYCRSRIQALSEYY